MSSRLARRGPPCRKLAPVSLAVNPGVPPGAYHTAAIVGVQAPLPLRTSCATARGPAATNLSAYGLRAWRAYTTLVRAPSVCGHITMLSRCQAPCGPVCRPQHNPAAAAALWPAQYARAHSTLMHSRGLNIFNHTPCQHRMSWTVRSVAQPQATTPTAADVSPIPADATTATYKEVGVVLQRNSSYVAELQPTQQLTTRHPPVAGGVCGGGDPGTCAGAQRRGTGVPCHGSAQETPVQGWRAPVAAADPCEGAACTSQQPAAAR
jgi:hypothetical protein